MKTWIIKFGRTTQMYTGNSKPTIKQIKPEKMRGIELDFIVIDEIKDIKQK